MIIPSFSSIVYALMLAFAILVLVFFVILKSTRNLVSLAGIALLLLIAVLMSRFPGRVSHLLAILCPILFEEHVIVVFSLFDRSFGSPLSVVSSFNWSLPC